jgi:hypothetical protein
MERIGEITSVPGVPPPEVKLFSSTSSYSALSNFPYLPSTPGTGSYHAVFLALFCVGMIRPTRHMVPGPGTAKANPTKSPRRLCKPADRTGSTAQMKKTS